MESKPVIGIDFGTTYCCVGVWIEGGVSIIPNSIGERTTPSVVIFDGPNQIFVGEDTLYHIIKEDSVKVYEIKRIIGKKYNQIKDLLKYFTFKIEEDNNGEPIIRINQNKTTSQILFKKSSRINRTTQKSGNIKNDERNK